MSIAKKFFENPKKFIFSLLVVGVVMISGCIDMIGCYCYSCASCTAKLNDNNCKEVKLIKSISPLAGTCINSLQNFTNKIFDCQGNRIYGDDEVYGYGIYLGGKSNNTIKNCIVTDFYMGIRLDFSSNITLTNNIVNSNRYGCGVYLSYSSNTTLTNNIVNSNGCGIHLSHSLNTIMKNNTMKDNADNFGIEGDNIFHYYQDIDKSNLVDNKPIYYYTNEKNAPNNCRNAEINELSNAGFVALVSCNNITVKNLNLSKNSHGILVVNTTNSKILHNTVNSGWYGIYLYHSSNTTMKNNTMNNNTYNFCVDGSDIFHYYQDIDKSNLVDNKPIYYYTNEKNAPNNCINAEINELSNAGFVALVSCNNITVKNLNLSKNSYGILLVNTTNSKILNNTVNLNLWHGIYLYYCSNNTLVNNRADSNWDCGIYLQLSLNNLLTNNTANSNIMHGVCIYSSSNNLLMNNTANNNFYNGLHINDTASIGNKLNYNHFCFNAQIRDYYDIYNRGNNTGTNNTCDTTFNYSDDGAVGCTSKCRI